MKSRGISAGLLLTLLSLFAFPKALLLSAQDKQAQKAEAQLRTLHGTVIDKDENPVASGVVYLLNVKSQAITTHIADETGNYRFSGLDPNVDYEIHAEHDDLVSATRTLSSYDSRKDIEITLKLVHPKKS